MKKRILLAGLFHETNTFNSDHTGRDKFFIKRDKELLDTLSDGSPMGAFLEYAGTREWEVIPTVDYRAVPSGLISDVVFEEFLDEFAARLRSAGRLDAVYLVLHGAMVFESHPDPEGELTAFIRAQPGMERMPIFGVYDLHANVTREMCDASNGLLTYRENPHTDAAESARRAAELLDRYFRTGVLPRTDYHKPPIIWPALGVGSADRPMRSLLALARKFENEHPEVWGININAGFSYSDIPVAGVSFSVITEGSPELSAHILETLTNAAWEERHLGIPEQFSVEEGIAQALSLGKGPVVLVESADNVGGGGNGDNTAVLRGLLAGGVQGGGVILHDPEAIASLAGKPIGSVVDIVVGGKNSHLDPQSADLQGARILNRTNGRFDLEDIHSHLASVFGRHIDMGETVTLECSGTIIVLTTDRMPPWDLGQWRSQGVDPEKLRIIGVKAAAAHRQAYNPIAVASIPVDFPGPCTSTLQNLTFKHLQRPIFPLDEISEPVFGAVPVSA